MPAKTNPPTARRFASDHPEPTDTDLLTLGCGQIAVALHVAGLPARWRTMSARGLLDLAAAGIAKIGLDEVLRIDAESKRILNALSEMDKQPDVDTSGERAQLDRIWPSAQGRQAATDAAWTIFHPAQPAHMTTRITGLLRIAH